MLAVGVLSGTSMDGIDVAIVRDPATRPRILSAKTFRYSGRTTRALENSADATPPRLAELNAMIAHDFAAAINRLIKSSNCSRALIRIVGSHGQTVYHIPGRSSLQLGSPAIIAVKTGIPVAADFRMDDIAVGGEGAPFAPALDAILFGARSRTKRIGALNLGGIANVTVLERGRIKNAYDIGPANSIIDAAMRLRYRKSCDRGGRQAASGRVHGAILSRALAHPYFRKPAPKTTGPELFGDTFVRRLSGKLAPSDVVATMTAISAEAAARELDRLELDEVFVSGGGLRNPTLMKLLRSATSAPIRSTADAGVDPDFKEAVLFAHLGACRLLERPIDLTAVTGSSRPKILGGLWLP